MCIHNYIYWCPSHFDDSISIRFKKECKDDIIFERPFIPRGGYFRAAVAKAVSMVLMMMNSMILAVVLVI